MNISFSKNEFVAAASYDYKDELKSLGWKYHPNSRTWRVTASYVAGVTFANFMTPAATKKLAELKKSHCQEIEKSRSMSSEIDVPVPEGKKFLPFQLAGIAYLIDHPKAILADEMGLGKTIQVIGLTNVDSAIDSVLVVCPATLRLNWQREFSRWSTRDWEIEVISSAKQQKGNAQVVIVSYDLLAKHPMLLQSEWGLVVYDEAHYLKNKGAKRTSAAFGLTAEQSAMRLAKQHKFPELYDFYDSFLEKLHAVQQRIDKDENLHAAQQQMTHIGIRGRRVVFVTGTPIPNRPVEIWPIVQQVDPDGLGKSYNDFVNRYCNAQKNHWGRRDVRGASNLGELQARLRSTCLIRRLKMDVLPELPPKIHQLIEIEATGPLCKLVSDELTYEQAQTEAKAEIARLRDGRVEPEYEDRLIQLRSFEQIAITELSRIRHELAVAKIPAILEHVDAIFSDGCEKLVVMAHHVSISEALINKYPDAAIITGDIPPPHRQAIADRFQEDPACKLCICSIKAAGVGLTLTAASILVFAEQDWVPGNMLQGEDRLHRIGQKQSVLIRAIVVDGSLDANIAKLLLEKRKTISLALDDPMPDFTSIQLPAASKKKPNSDKATAKRLSSEQRNAIHLCLCFLAAADPDRAAEANGAGFNRFDGKLGHKLAGQKKLSETQARQGLGLLLKYSRQIPIHLFRPAVGGDSLIPSDGQPSAERNATAIAT